MAKAPSSRRFSPVASVPFLFGALNATAIPGTILASLLVDTGMSEAAARTLLARMKNRGAVTVERIGRVGLYRLGGTMLTAFKRIGQGSTSRPWDGNFHTILYDLPESERRVKDHLRYMAHTSGYGTLRPGVLINPHAQELPPAFHSLQTTRLVMTGRLSFDLATARQAAETAWSLNERAALIRELHRQIRLTLDPASIPTEARSAFREYHNNYLESIELRRSDPYLPPELLPDAWEGNAFSASLRTMTKVWNDAVSAHLEALISSSPHGHLIQRNHHLFS